MTTRRNAPAPEDCARLLGPRFTALAGAPVRLDPSDGVEASGAGVTLSGAIEGGGGAISVWLDETLARALSAAVSGAPLEALADVARTLEPFAAEAAAALVEAVGPGDDGAPRIEPPVAEATAAVPAAAGPRAWLRGSVGTVSGKVAIELGAQRTDDRRPPEVLLDIEIPFAVTLGSVEMTLGEIQQLDTGAVLPLGRVTEGQVQLVVGGRVLARGELVVVDGCFGIRVATVESPERRLTSLGRA